MLLASLLIVLLCILALEVGAPFYPSWLIAYRRQIIGVLAFALIAVLVAAPLVVEANTHPRPLSGMGKSPKGPRLP